MADAPAELGRPRCVYVLVCVYAWDALGDKENWVSNLCPAGGLEHHNCTLLDPHTPDHRHALIDHGVMAPNILDQNCISSGKV